jgi:hypothetical protein
MNNVIRKNARPVTFIIITHPWLSVFKDVCTKQLWCFDFWGLMRAGCRAKSAVSYTNRSYRFVAQHGAAQSRRNAQGRERQICSLPRRRPGAGYISRKKKLLEKQKKGNAILMVRQCLK